MTRWIVEILLRLYPASFRRRYATDVGAAARRLDEDGSRTARVRAVVDALVTLVRAWRDRLADAVAEVTGRPGSGDGDPGWRGPGGPAGSASGGPSLAGDLVQDLRHAVRSLRHRPGYLAVAVATLAVGLGANGVVFDVAWAVLGRALPYASPERVSQVEPPPVGLSLEGEEIVFAPAPWLSEISLLEEVALFSEEGGATLAGEDDATRVSVSEVSPGFFRVLGASLLMGRSFAEGEKGVAVMSHGLWRRAFGADPAILGHTLLLSGRPYEVVGVAAPEVAFPGATDVWLPLPLTGEFYGAAIGPSVIARARPGVAPEVLATALGDRAEEEARERGDPPDDRVLRVTPLRDRLVGSVRAPLLVLLTGSGLILLLACTNLAALTLSRTLSRAGELGVRRALGAGRRRVARHLLTETLLVALLGGVAAAALAAWGGPLLLGMLPAELPGREAVGLGAPLLLFLTLATVAAGLAAGGLPALHGAAAAGLAGRREGRGASRAHSPAQAALTIMQIGLAVVLVTGAGLLGRSLAGLYAVPPGFDRDGVLTFEVRLPETVYPDADAWTAAREGLEEALAGMPGVQGVGSSSRLPFSDGMGVGLRIWAADGSEEDAERISAMEASAGYFDALGIAVLEGRAFDPAGEPEPAAILGRGAARALFGEGPAVGRTIRIRRSSRHAPARATVVGVVADVRYLGLRFEERSRLYEPLSAQPVPYLGFAVRTAGDPAALAPAVRDVVAEVDPGLAPYGVRTSAQALRSVVATEEALALVATLFGLGSLVLAGLGVYGLVAQGVEGRRREMGVRLALGAGERQVWGLVVRTGMALALPGVVLGSLATVALGGRLEPVLHDVGARDPLTLAAVPLATLVVALLATVLPARRAAGTDPVESLRSE